VIVRVRKTVRVRVTVTQALRKVVGRKNTTPLMVAAAVVAVIRGRAVTLMTLSTTAMPMGLVAAGTVPAQQSRPTLPWGVVITMTTVSWMMQTAAPLARKPRLFLLSCLRQS